MARLAALLSALLAGSIVMAAADGAAAPVGSPQLAQPTSKHADGTQLDAFWARALEEDYKSPAELVAQDQREHRKGYRYLKLTRGAKRSPKVALTFDDGPHPEFTPKLLDILKRYNVKATFFVVGKLAEQHPDLIRAETLAGHEVGNHTYHHVNLTKIPVNEIAVEWQACQEVVKSETGNTMRACRPPGGDYDKDVIAIATRLGLITVLWTDDPGDYANPGEKVIRSRVLRWINNGAIILLHDGVQQTIDVLPQIIETLQARGMHFQTASEMAAAAGLHL